MGLGHSLSKVERVVLDHCAQPQLESLVSSGCNREELLTALELAFLTDESWKALLGMSLPRFKRALKQIRDVAEIITRLNQSEFIYHASIELRLPLFSRVHDAPTLSDQLRDYADRLDSVRLVFGPEHKPRLHAWKAWIVAMVMEDTNRPHDPEVSSLIAAVLNKKDYSEKAHQKWRLEQQDRIDAIRGILRKHRSNSSALPLLPIR